MKPDNIFLIDKPSDMTSFGVVARIRRKLCAELGVKKLKVGHNGTLDPFATGLLMIFTGKKTKEIQNYMKLDKIYEATLKLGETSTTGDPEGEILSISDQEPSISEIENSLKSFLGNQLQTPPAFSALKINGQPAYKLARAGKSPELKPRPVTVHRLELISYNYPELRVKAHVSSGTYIRTLAEDIGKDLKTGAYLTALHRTAIGDYKIQDAIPLQKFMESDNISSI